MPAPQPLQSLKRSEWLLFLAPLLVLGSAFVGGPLRQRLFPVPTPTPTPRPYIKTLWNNSSNGYERIIPARDGKTIFTKGYAGAGEKVISVWDVKTGLRRRTFSDAQVHGSFALAVSDDGRRAAYTLDGPWNLAKYQKGIMARTGIYDGASGKRLHFLPTKNDFAWPHFLPRSHHLFLGLPEYFEIWDSDSGKLLKRSALRAASGTQKASAFAGSPNGKYLAVTFSAGVTEMGYVAGRADEIGLFNNGPDGSPQKSRPTHTFSWPQTLILDSEFVNNSRQLVVLGNKYQLSKKQKRSLPPNASPLDTASDDSATAPAINSTTSLYLLDWQNGRRELIEQSRDSQYPRLAASPDGQFVALTYTIIKPSHTPNDSVTVTNNVNTTTYIPSNNVAVYTSPINIYEVRSGRKIASLWLARDVPDSMGNVEYHGRVDELAFAPDNSTLYYRDNETHLVTRWPRQNWKIGATPPEK